MTDQALKDLVAGLAVSQAELTQEICPTISSRALNWSGPPGQAGAEFEGLDGPAVDLGYGVYEDPELAAGEELVKSAHLLS